MTLPINRTNLTAAAINQVPNALIQSALNIAALTTPYDTIDELNVKVDAHAAAVVLPHADLSVTQSKLALQAVGTAQIAPLAVTTSTIADGNVTAAKLDPALSTQTLGLSAHILLSPIDHPAGSITLSKLDLATQNGIIGGMIYEYKNYGGF